MDRTKVTNAGVAALVFALGLAGAAWACTPQAVVSVSQSVGSPRENVVRVQGFGGDAPIEIRWNSVQGQVLGVAQGPDFEMPVSPPAEAASGTYYIVAIQRGEGGGVAMKGTAMFEVAEASRSAQNRSSGAESTAWLNSVLSETANQGPSGARTGLIAGFALLSAGLFGIAWASALIVVKKRGATSLSEYGNLGAEQAER